MSSQADSAPLKTWRKSAARRATGRDRSMAEWLKWLCENGSLPGRH
jgi:hypothetical protein